MTMVKYADHFTDGSLENPVFMGIRHNLHSLIFQVASCIMKGFGVHVRLRVNRPLKNTCCISYKIFCIYRNV